MTDDIREIVHVIRPEGATNERSLVTTRAPEPAPAPQPEPAPASSPPPQSEGEALTQAIAGELDKKARLLLVADALRRQIVEVFDPASKTVARALKKLDGAIADLTAEAEHAPPPADDGGDGAEGAPNPANS